MVFIDDDTSRDEYNYATVKYSIFNGSSWSSPVIIDNDGTTDEAPDIYVLDNGKVLAVWSSAVEALTAEDTAITALNKMDIKSAVFDTATDTFSEPAYITKTTAADKTADSAPKLVSGSYLNNDDYIMCYYTKSEYTASDGGEGVIGDVINPYSVIAYLFYDVNSGEWVHTYSDTDKAEIINTGMAYTNSGELVTADNFDVYEAEWYGQSFVDLGVNLSIDETDLTDEYGYWTGTPDISVSEAVADPLVVDSDAISYNNLSIYAYTVDLDGSQETIYDREIYVQVYDFDDNSFTYPIQISNNDVNDSGVKLGRFDDNTYLIWLSGGDIKALDFSNIYKNCLAEYTYGGKTYYYVNKAEDSYIPEMVIADAGEGTEIGEFEITADDSSVYVVWTQSGLTYAEGIEQSDAEATNPENQFLEYQVYASRYTAGDEGTEDLGYWSNAMQLTFGQGAVYSELLPYISESGTVSVIAEKGESSVDATYGVVEDINSRSMVRLDFSDFERIELSDITIGEFAGNDTTEISVTVSNTGMTDCDNLSLQFYSDGVLFETEEIGSLSEGSDIEMGTIIGGNVIEAKLYSGDELIAETSEEVEYAPEITVDEVNITVLTRDDIAVSADVSNNGNAEIENLTITVVSNTTGETVGETVIDSLAVGATQTVILEGTINENMFTEITPTDEDYYYEESAEFTISAGEYASVSAEMSRYITNDENELLSSIDPVLNDGAESIEVALNDYELAYDSVSDEYSALQVLWESSDDSVASVTTGGLITGVSLGTATLTATIAPADRTIVILEDGSYGSDSIYEEIPESGMIVKTITVNVVNEVVTEETTEETTEESSEETTVAEEESSEETTAAEEESSEETTAAADETSETTTAASSSSSSGSSSGGSSGGSSYVSGSTSTSTDD
ncbi:MAG: Ig-like domain-containing protein, partial [Clostridiales bacterium]|nr:Ig-like domain-containing protein [Clostridiales bacterium]